MLAKKTKVTWYYRGNTDSSNKVEYFSYEGEWASAFKRRLAFSFIVIILA